MELYDLLEEYGKTHDGKLEAEIKNALLPFKQGSIGIAQINPVIGDLKNNAKKIVEYINFAQNIGLEAVAFPELALSGYPIEDVVKNHPHIVEENLKWLKEIAKITTKTTALVGFAEKNDGYFSSVAVLQDGEIKEIIRKPLLPAFCDFNSCKFAPKSADSAKIIEISGKKYLITLSNANCGVADAIIYFSDNPLRTKKEQNKISDKNKPLICVNLSGAVDNVSFEGASCVYDKNGSIIARLKSFEEQFLIVNPFQNIGKIYPSFDFKAKDEFSLNYEDDLERTYKIIIQGIKNYFAKNGLKRAVLGLSGGLDSTVCAVLLADALNKENVYGISMPSKLTSQESKSDAQKLAENLGINYSELTVKNVVSAIDSELQPLYSEIEKKWDFRYKQSYTMDNIQARSRAVYLWSVSNEFEACIPIATSDKSEIYMGYATINGDMTGGFAPIADITKTKLFALAKWLNKNREVKNAIPESIIQKRPSAELAINPKTGKALLAEEALMPYEFLDEAIWRFENKHENYYDMLNSTFIYEQENSVSKEQKAEWLDKFYSRMLKGRYKLSILPPTVIVDSRSFNKNEYRQPITTASINYKPLEEKEIEGFVKSF